MNIFKKLADLVLGIISNIKWFPNAKIICKYEQEQIKKLLINDYYIILTRRTNHLSTYLINLSDFILTGKFGFWSHVLMNLEDEVKSDNDFRLIEATKSNGVAYVAFDKVFNVQYAALLKPKNLDLAQWTGLLDSAKKQLGKEYDTLYNIREDRNLSCIELIYVILKESPNYEKNFNNFDKLIKQYGNLTPQMLADCADFELVYLGKR